MEQEVKQPVESKPIEWEAESFETHQRSRAWYVGFTVILLIVLAAMIYLRQWLLAGVVLMLGVVWYLSGRLRSAKTQCRIDAQGVTVGGKTFSYDQLKSFWMSQLAGQWKLHLITTFRFVPVISILITPDLAERIRTALGDKVPESKNQGEDWIDRINRLLKI